MEFRETSQIELRKDSREVVGIAVPYNQVTEIRGTGGSFKESFEPNSVADFSEGPTYYRHDHTQNGISIGYIKEATNTPEGLRVVTRIHKTAKGDAVLADVASGKIRSFSIGFNPVEHREQDGVIVRTKVSLEEVSLVEVPAYAGAAISELREAGENTTEGVTQETMTDSNNYDDLSSGITELRESFTELERKVIANENTMEVREAAGSSSLAEAVIAAYNGKDVSADAMQVRAYTGATTADNVNRPIWVDKELKFIEQRRPLASVFGSEPIPGDSGMAIEYNKIGTRTGSVAKQAAEGDNLTYNKVTIVDASAPIETLGGYAELSVQALKFGKAPLLQTTLKSLSVNYAKATEAEIRAKLVGATGVNAVTRGSITGANAASGWIGAVEDGLVAIDDNSMGLGGTHVIVSRDVHKSLLTTTDTTGRPLFVVNGDGSNTYGSVRPGAAGQAVIAGLPVVSVPQLPANSFYVVSNEALLIWESSIFELSDKNIVNLTELRSLYGYLATGVYDNKGIAKVTWS
jgi:HK97 family phage prohead protease